MDLHSENRSYWDKRAPSYTGVIQKNLSDGWDAVWAEALISHFPEKDDIKVLDVGTGPGFYSIILASRGYAVTAVDFSPEMLAQAKENAGGLKEKITFLQMDAQALSFGDNSFDVIVTRNLTWNLPNPGKAYAEWHRVLKPGGVLLNFDANWYGYLFDEEKNAAFHADRENVSQAGVEDHEAYPDADQMEIISLCLPLSKMHRPQWDVACLGMLGFEEISADTQIGDRVWNEEEKLNYHSTPGFLIKAVKSWKTE